MTYQEIRSRQATLKDCFFAFSDSQFDEGVIREGLQGVKIYSGQHNLYGTLEGIRDFYNFYKQQRIEIGKNCTPQEVYDFECINHEVSYTHDDSEAFEICCDYFGDRAKEINRRWDSPN